MMIHLRFISTLHFLFRFLLFCLAVEDGFEAPFQYSSNITSSHSWRSSCLR